MNTFRERMPFSNYLSRLPVQVSELVQVGRGCLDFSSLDVWGQDSFIVRFRTQARSVFSVVPEKDWWGILVPLSWSGDYLMNGWEATPTTVFQLDGRHEYHVTAERRDALTVGVRRAVLECAIASLLGQECCRLPHNHQALEIPDDHRKRLTTSLSNIIAVAAARRSTDDFSRMSRAIENELISMIADWIIEKDDIQTPSHFG